MCNGNNKALRRHDNATLYNGSITHLEMWVRARSWTRAKPQRTISTAILPLGCSTVPTMLPARSWPCMSTSTSRFSSRSSVNRRACSAKGSDVVGAVPPFRGETEEAEAALLGTGDAGAEEASPASLDPFTTRGHKMPASEKLMYVMQSSISTRSVEPSRTYSCQHTCNTSGRMDECIVSHTS